MRNNILIFMAGILLGAGVIYFCVSQKEVEPSSVKKQITDAQVFEMKKECGRIKTEIEKKLQNASYAIPDGTKNYYFLEEIFYSPKANTCLYLERNTTYEANKPVSESHTLKDAFTEQFLDVANSGYYVPLPGSRDYDKVKETEYTERKLNFQQMVMEFKK